MTISPDHVKSGSKCLLCGSELENCGGWPAPNEDGCIGSYHDGGYGSLQAPGFCGVRERQWLP